MKLRPVNKIDKKKKKQRDDDFMSENCETLSFFQFTANLEQCRSRIPDA